MPTNRERAEQILVKTPVPEGVDREEVINNLVGMMFQAQMVQDIEDGKFKIVKVDDPDHFAYSKI